MGVYLKLPKFRSAPNSSLPGECVRPSSIASTSIIECPSRRVWRLGRNTFSNIAASIILLVSTLVHPSFLRSILKIVLRIAWSNAMWSCYRSDRSSMQPVFPCYRITRLTIFPSQFFRLGLEVENLKRLQQTVIVWLAGTLACDVVMTVSVIVVVRSAAFSPISVVDLGLLLSLFF